MKWVGLCRLISCVVLMPFPCGTMVKRWQAKQTWPFPSGHQREVPLPGQYSHHYRSMSWQNADERRYFVLGHVDLRIRLQSNLCVCEYSQLRLLFFSNLKQEFWCLHKPTLSPWLSSSPQNCLAEEKRWIVVLQYSEIILSHIVSRGMFSAMTSYHFLSAIGQSDQCIELVFCWIVLHKTCTLFCPTKKERA